jgi:hypothetical protein
MVTRSKVLKSESVTLKEQKVKIPTGEGTHRPEVDLNFGKASEPHVDIVRGDDGTIEAILVRCTCGRETTLHCEYLDEGVKK